MSVSKYTTQLRWIVETYSGNTPGNNGDIESMIAIAAPKIFNFDYPIWGNTAAEIASNQAKLNADIIRHYYMREICAETVALWKLWLRERMFTIMPYYVDLYASIAAKYDMLSDIDYTEVINRHHDNTDTTTGSQTGTHNDTTTSSQTVESNLTEDHATHGNRVDSDYPQAQIGMTDYATDGGETNGTQTANDSSKTETSGTVGNDGGSSLEIENKLVADHQEDTTLTRKGMTGSRSYATLIREYRENLININKMIYNDLRDLFMQVY